MINKKTTLILFSVFTLLFYLVEISQAWAQNTSVNVENKISTTANSGGNKIEGEAGNIKTGDAKASVKSTIISNSQTSVTVQAKAETGGQSLEAQIENNGETEAQKVEKSEDGASVAIEIDTENNKDAENLLVRKDEGFIENIISAAKNFFNNLISWFN